MFGVAVNCLAILVCSLAGCFCLRKIPVRFEDILKKALGLSTVYIGLKGAFDNQRPLLLIMSMVTGALLGELIDIDALFNKAGRQAERLLAKKSEGAGKEGNFSRGFVQASILFCSGSMAIVGSLQSGLLGSHETLYAKSVLDGSFSLVFAASLGRDGLGIALSALSVFVYQGAIAALSGVLRGVLTADIIREMSAAGSLLVAAIGFNFIGDYREGREIKVANLIPAVFIPALYMGLIEPVVTRIME
ncbi:MAG: DUF554 domain-containing protein [Spirochaetaceae bacterium]|jgi:uncharacterized membrane protein YqgA involved in biofilm formation|nr:DUF554 domain-containing protein [Spirochaetaceae bacterium]